MENPRKGEIPIRFNTKDTEENAWNTPEATEFDSVGKAKLTSLQERLEEIQEMIRQRKILSNKLTKEAEKMKSNIDRFLMENAPRGEDDSEFTRERAELRKKQIEISEIQLKEAVECWKDTALLKKEMRDNAKELSEKKSRAEMLGKILEE